MEKISCVLITRAKEYPSILMDRLDIGFFDEILVKTESPSVYNRYLLAKEARNECLFFVDDDAMVNFQQLYRHYNGRITNAMTQSFQWQYEQLGCTLVGWGSYQPKSMLGVFDKYISKYSADDPHLLREADRIFTYLNKPFNSVLMPHEDLPRATSDEAMWKDPNHYQSMKEALMKCSTL